MAKGVREVEIPSPILLRTIKPALEITSEVNAIFADERVSRGASSGRSACYWPGGTRHRSQQRVLEREIAGAGLSGKQ